MGFIKILALIPVGLFYPKLLINFDPNDDKYFMWVARAALLISCTWNAVLYLSTVRELRTAVFEVIKKVCLFKNCRRVAENVEMHNLETTTGNSAVES